MKQNSYIMKYVRCTVRVSRIRSEMSWSSTHTKIWTLKQLHHCTQCLNHKDISILCFKTPLAVIKDEKIVKNQHSGLKLPLFDLKPSECNVRCQNLIGCYASTHSTFNLVGSCNRNPNTQSHKHTYAQTTDIWPIFSINEVKCYHCCCEEVWIRLFRYVRSYL